MVEHLYGDVLAGIVIALINPANAVKATSMPSGSPENGLA
jgi:hypothetical protein